MKEARQEFEKEYLSFQIKRFNGNITKTAEFIEMDRSALHKKLKDLNIYYKLESHIEESFKNKKAKNLDKITERNLEIAKGIRESISGLKPIVKVHKDDFEEEKKKAFTKKFEDYSYDNASKGQSISDPFSIMKK